MSEADLSSCDRLRQEAGWNQTKTDWKRFLDLSPRGCFVAVMEGAVVGTVTTVTYGPEVGWIGMLLVEQTVRRRGIGQELLRAALKYLREGNVRCVKLDATPLGESLYQRVGFRREGMLTRFGGKDVERCRKSEGVRDLCATDVQAVVELDAAAFGVKRPELIKSLCASAQRTLIQERSHRIESFGLLRTGVSADYLGPIVAESAHGAEELVRELMRERPGRPIYWDVLTVNVEAVRLAERIGFVPQRNLVRMFFGEKNRSGIAAKYFGIADPSLG